MFPSTFQVYILLRQALDVISQGRKVISKLSLKYIFLSHETLDQVLSITYIYIYIYMIYQFGVLPYLQECPYISLVCVH